MSEPQPFDPLTMAEAEAAELRRLLEDARQRCERAEVLATWQGGHLSRDQALDLLDCHGADLDRAWEEMVFRVLRRWREYRDRSEGKQ